MREKNYLGLRVQSTDDANTPVNILLFATNLSDFCKPVVGCIKGSICFTVLFALIDRGNQEYSVDQSLEKSSQSNTAQIFQDGYYALSTNPPILTE
jgi:hypothetical protein